MPPLGAALGDEGVKDVAHYVLLLSGSDSRCCSARRQGKANFDDDLRRLPRRGRQRQPGARRAEPDRPHLALRRQPYDALSETIRNGRTNQMPAWGEFLGEEKTHLLAAYVWGLSHGK